ncbi:MAG: hypothetical protein WC045_01020 [Patescibacteria group bacterium]
MNKLTSFIKLVFVMAIAFGLSYGVAYFVEAKKSNKTITDVFYELTKNTTVDGKYTEGSVPSPAKKLGDLGIFEIDVMERNSGPDFDVVYLDGGIIQEGEFAGYHRVFGRVPEYGPGGATIFVFATKDYQTYVIDVGTDTSNFNLADATAPDKKYEDGQSMGNHWLSTKVNRAAHIPLEHPETIKLGKFTLVRAANFYYWTRSVQFEFNPGEYVRLNNASSVPDLIFWMEKPSSDTVNLRNTEEARDAKDTEYDTQFAKYVAGTSDIFVQDKNGVVVRYDLHMTSQVNREKVVDQYGNNLTPSSYFISKDLGSTDKFYNTYDSYIHHACQLVGSTQIIRNVEESELVKVVTTKDGVDLFAPAETDHPLNMIAYYNKIYSIQKTGVFAEVNSNKAVPTLDEYVAKHPVLIFKTPWNQWAAVTEYDYGLLGGCGKPVIYLYPEKPTDVTVKFEAPMQFTTQIPTYSDGWKVNASPDGKLTDLQPGKTNCEGIDFSHTGSEYAQESCKTGSYPYLYWAGNTSNTYPQTVGGWIVARHDIASVIQEKLTTIGLTAKETADMMEYWVPELINKNAPYYRLSFLQAPELNKFIPMQVTPQPQTTIRVFLDWEPFNAKPEMELKPQTLRHIDRSGFTLVEWGGLKR